MIRKAHSPVSITIWSWDVALAHLEEWAEKFQEENPDVSFNFEEMGVDQVYQKMTTCLQSGIGLPDIVSIEGEQMAKFGEKFPGKFEEFTDMINPDDFFPIKLSECTVDGKDYCLSLGFRPVRHVLQK